MVLPYCKSCIDLSPEAGLATCTVLAKDGCKLCVKCYGRPALRDQMDKDGKTYAVEKDIKFITLSEAENNRWEAKVKPIPEEYVKAMKEKNLSGDEVLKFCKDYLAKSTKKFS